jgi:hypothetical protein
MLLLVGVVEQSTHNPVERRTEMKIEWKWFAALLLLSACQQAPDVGNASQAASMKGAGGQMPAFYDDQVFTVNMTQLPNSDPLIAHNKSINTIYATNDLDEEQLFFPVLDAIQGDGFNPLWLQVLIVYNPGVTPFQLTSDTEVLADAAGPHPLITLVPTDEVYRCAVVGPKK